LTWQKTITHMRHRRVAPPEPSTVELTWKVKNVDASNVEQAWDPFTYGLSIVDDAGLPIPGSKLTGHLPNTTSGDWSVLFRCRELNWEHLNDSFSVWQLRAVFSCKDAFCPLPHIFRTDSTRFRTVDMWHAGAPTQTMVESSAQWHEVAAADYQPVAQFNKPVKYEVPQQELVVSYVWNTSIPSSTGNGYPNVQAVVDSSYDFLNARNDTEFLGFPKGTVRLMGVTVDPDEDEYVRVSYQFVYDYWGFMSQVPKALPGTSGAFQPVKDANGNYYPATVVFDQGTYGGFAEFNDLLSANDVNYLVKGWVHYDTVACETPAAGSTATAITVDPYVAQLGVDAGIRDEEAAP
jgi:hypothetical protein